MRDVANRKVAAEVFFSLSEWSYTIRLTPYNRTHNVLSASLKKSFFLSMLYIRICTFNGKAVKRGAVKI